MMRPKLKKEGSMEGDLSPSFVAMTENRTLVSHKGKRHMVQELMVPIFAWLLVKASWQEVGERKNERQISKDHGNT